MANRPIAGDLHVGIYQCVTFQRCSCDAIPEVRSTGNSDVDHPAVGGSRTSMQSQVTGTLTGRVGLRFLEKP